MPISAVDTISLAYHHTKRQLIEPFRFWQWLRLAFVGLLAGEMGSGGGFNFNLPINSQQGGSSRHLIAQNFPHIDPALFGGLIAVLLITGLVLFVILLYISSVMRFILFDAILAKECRIRDGWNRRQGPGWKYFLWHLGLFFVSFAVMAVIVGIPVAVAFGKGWITHPRENVAPLVVMGSIVLLIFLVFFALAAIVQVFTKDFVVPQMALDGIGAVEGWRRLWEMMKVEKAGYAVYAGMKIVLAIGAGIVVTIVSVIIALIFAVPVIGVVIAAVFAGKNAGITWNAVSITAAIVAGCVLLAAYLFLISLISVPVIVFFPAYSIYFFAPRYRRLSLALYPPPNPLPPEPSPFTPAPQPI